MTTNPVCSTFSVHLYSDASGLSLKKKGKNGISFIFLSKFASKGLLFKTCLPRMHFVLIFPHVSSTELSNNELSTYIVICDSGEIFLVLIQKEGIGDSTKIGQIQANVIWSDFVKDDLYILESCGKLHIGNIKSEVDFNEENQLIWKSLLLPIIPICCIAMEDILVLSDGYSSYMCIVDKITTNCCEVLRLPYCGIISVEKTASEVVLNTCDGRQYTKTPSILKENSKTFSGESKASSLFIKDITLSSVMKSIKRYSDYTRNGKNKLDNINKYLEQISIAQTFLSKLPKTPFTVQLSVSCMEEEIYILSIQLMQIVSQIKLEGPWWQLNVKLKGCDTISCIYNDLICINNDGTCQFIKFKVPFTFMEKFISNHNQEVNIEFNLSFSHFSTLKPLCTFLIHKHPLDVLCFLSSSRSIPSNLNPTFEIKVSRIFQSISDEADRKEKVIPHHQQVFVLLRRKLQPALDFLFPETFEGKDSLSCIKWLRQDMIKLKCDKIDNLIRISVEGTFRLLITAVKFAIEKRAINYIESDNSTNINTVKLQSELYKKVRITKTILDLETSTEFPSDVAIQRIYDSLNDVISSIFL